MEEARTEIDEKVATLKHEHSEARHGPQVAEGEPDTPSETGKWAARVSTARAFADNTAGGTQVDTDL